MASWDALGVSPLLMLKERRTSSPGGFRGVLTGANFSWKASTPSLFFGGPSLIGLGPGSRQR